MRSGDLSMHGAPQVAIDWRVVFVDPEQGPRWRRVLWRAALRFSWSWALTRLLVPKQHIDQWLTLRSNAGDFSFAVVTIGPPALMWAAIGAAERGGLWINRVYGYATWHSFADYARADRDFVELLHLDPNSLPVMTGVPVRAYTGFGTQPGK